MERGKFLFILCGTRGTLDLFLSLFWFVIFLICSFSSTAFRFYFSFFYTSHPGCICKDGFLGEYCEFLNVERTNGVARKAFWGFAICALSLAAIYMMWKFCQSQDTIERVPTGIPDYDPNYDFEVEHDNSLDMADPDNDARVYGMDNKDIVYG
jgi:hypothetical protein